MLQLWSYEAAWLVLYVVHMNALERALKADKLVAVLSTSSEEVPTVSEVRDTGSY